MRRKFISIIVATMALAMFQKATFADFNAEEFARNFNESVAILPGSNEARRVMSLYHWPVEWRLLDAYAPSTSGEVDPSRPWDIGTFYYMSSSGYDPGAFYYGDDIYFSSFVLNSAPSTLYEYRATLSYDNGATRTSDGRAINLGIVYLYTQYATGVYGVLDDYRASEFNRALQLLLTGTFSSEWFDNWYLSVMIEMSLPFYWLIEYDLNYTSYPTWIDNDYAVYVMNLSQIDYDRLPELYPPIPYLPVGDVLYLVRRDNGGGSDGVPEPATLLLWTGIGLGMVGAARYRKRRTLSVGDQS